MNTLNKICKRMIEDRIQEDILEQKGFETIAELIAELYLSEHSMSELSYKSCEELLKTLLPALNIPVTDEEIKLVLFCYGYDTFDWTETIKDYWSICSMILYNWCRVNET